MISPSQRPLPDNTQHSQQTNIHAPGGIRTHDRSRRAAVGLRLRPHGYWDRRLDDLSIRCCRATSVTVTDDESERIKNEAVVAHRVILLAFTWREQGRLTRYSMTPLNRIKWDGMPSGYTENPDNWIFLYI